MVSALLLKHSFVLVAKGSQKREMRLSSFHVKSAGKASMISISGPRLLFYPSVDGCVF